MSKLFFVPTDLYEFVNILMTVIVSGMSIGIILGISVLASLSILDIFKISSK